MSRVFLSFWILLFTIQTVNAVERSNCYLPHFNKIHLGMTYGQFFDYAEVGLMYPSLLESEKEVTMDHFITEASEIQQWTYTFYLPDWLLENVIPSDAILKEVEVQFDKEVDIRSILFDLLGNPESLTVPDAGVFYPYDARWFCELPNGEKLQISLHHRRVLYESIKE